MPKRFPVYRRLVKLYPKKYREQYGEQMIQTLADMLDDQPSSFGRLDVWLRASFDLPITIVQQNINTLGDSTMNQKIQHTFKNHKKGIIVVAVIIAISLGALLRDFRQTVLPELVQPFYGHSAKVEFNKQRTATADPVQSLAGKTTKTTALCNFVAMQNIHTQLDCSASQRSYITLPQTEKARQNLNTTIQKIEAALSIQGYNSGSNGMTLTKLVQGTYKGQDYNPDAYYEKSVGKYTCVFDTMIAYANPKPPAIQTSLSCSRTLNIFGAPNYNGGNYIFVGNPAH